MLMWMKICDELSFCDEVGIGKSEKIKISVKREIIYDHFVVCYLVWITNDTNKIKVKVEYLNLYPHYGESL